MALLLGALTALAATGRAGENRWQDATAQNLPRWYGFNLLEKFHRDWSNKPFVEADFRLISQWGFNFVRLPMDYRTWIVDGDWGRLNEEVLKEIDQAVAWGEKYGIHVCLNFHRAPGYSVAEPKEATDLWTDPATQAVCALHWGAFARRYRGIPSARLSFNLMNEPAGINGTTYAAVVQLLVDAIRQEDPQRLIICDGLQWGSQPCLELLSLGVAQATRGYTPFQLTHYKANWIQGADTWPLPTWPRLLIPGTLYTREEYAGALRLEGPFAAAYRLRLRVGVVSNQATLVVRADGVEILRREFVCGAGQGEWKEAGFNAAWNIYQNRYDFDCEAAIPAGARVVECVNESGDWMQLTELGLTRQGTDAAEQKLALDTTWGRTPGQVRFDPAAGKGPFSGGTSENRDWLRETAIAPWKEAQAKGIGVMVGEWGAFNQTPHDVFLRWAEDCLRNWQEAGWGWAVWNFRGAIGVLDSGRADVVYEQIEGHQLDRAFLELLQRYARLGLAAAAAPAVPVPRPSR
jgi:aryl-phospho-beta-D-glucosidase BglC (GH1 family)